MIDAVRATRHGEVVGHSIQEIARGDSRFPPEDDQMFIEKGVPDTLWFVAARIHWGTTPESSLSVWLWDETEVEEFLKMYPLGHVFRDGDLAVEKHPMMREILNTVLEAEGGLKTFGAGIDPDVSLPEVVLAEAGLIEGFQGPLADIVVEFCASDLADWMSRYEESYRSIALFAYAWSCLPTSSPAYIACQYLLLAEAIEDEFRAGYALRDLEIVYHGHESAVRRDRDFAARQTERSAKGVLATAEKKARRSEAFQDIALTHLAEWLSKSEAAQVAQLRRLAEKYDNELDEPLFEHGGRTLSKNWFHDALSDLRQSGKIEIALAKLAQGK